MRRAGGEGPGAAGGGGFHGGHGTLPLPSLGCSALLEDPRLGVGVGAMGWGMSEWEQGSSGSALHVRPPLWDHGGGQTGTDRLEAKEEAG